MNRITLSDDYREAVDRFQLRLNEFTRLLAEQKRRRQARACITTAYAPPPFKNCIDI